MVSKEYNMYKDNDFMIRKTAILLLQFILFFQFINGQKTTHSDYNSTNEWNDNKYSMFIHFGIYSELGGVWKGENVTFGYSEQIQSHTQMFSDEYEKVAESFLPEQWNADEIVLLAKNAGMRSVIITSKHHDGFCMFKTKTTKFNIIDATPFKRDVVKELSDACKRHGLNFGLYFSLIDWHYPQAYPMSSHNADFVTPEHHEFTKRQLKELLSNYGAISELWFDMGSLSTEQSKELRNLVKELQPNCMVSGRIGNDQGDFCVMGDNEYPDYTISTPWQTPASMYNETWSYRSWQEHIPVEEKTQEKLLSLIKTVTRGGNYILNIGPKGDGTVPQFEKEVLNNIGKWLTNNSEAIYGTRPIKLDKESSFGEMTSKGNKIYFFLMDTPKDDKIILEGITSEIIAVSPLNASTEKLVFTQNGTQLTINLSANFKKQNEIRVIVIENEGKVSVAPKNIIKLNSNASLNSKNGQHQFSFSGVDFYGSYKSIVTHEWNVKSKKNTIFSPEIVYSDEEKGKAYNLSINKKTIPIKLVDGKKFLLKSSKLKWGDIAISRKLIGFISSLHGELKDIEVTKKWGGKDWDIKKDWKLNKKYTKPADLIQNWYWLQEIRALKQTQTLIKVPTNDGVAIYLNGEEIYVVNNPLQEIDKETVVLLPLKKGVNQLLIKYFNRFKKTLNLSVTTNIPQVLYKKGLPKVELEKGKVNTIQLKASENYPVHQHLQSPNLSIEF